MPTYDFQCRKCGKLFEQRMTMTEFSAGTRPRCPECGDAKPRRAFSASINVLTSHEGAALPCERDGSCAVERGGACGGGLCGMNRG